MKMIKKIASLLVLVMALVAFVGCAPKDPAAAREKLEKAEYVVIEEKIIVPVGLAALGVKGIDSVMVATKEGEIVTMVYFKEKANASEYFDKVKEYAKDKDEDCAVKQSGNWIYYGSEQAMKDFN